MLIKDFKLDVEEFKSFYTKIKWQKAPRKLTHDHVDYFYVGEYSDEERVIRISIRPSKRMQISESFKGFDKAGKKLENNPEKGVNFGTTVEVVISEATLEKIKKLATIIEPIKIQKVGI